MIYKRIKINNYKGFQDFEISGLERVNLITGKNNVGKTNLLEAVFIMSGTSPILMLSTFNFRGMPFFQLDLTGSAAFESPLNAFFHNFNIANAIELSGVRDREEWHKVRIESSAPSALLVQTAGSESNLTFRGGVSQEICSFRYTDSNGKDISSRILFAQDKNDINLRVEPTPPRPDYLTIFISPLRMASNEDSERVGKLIASGKKQELVESLKIIEPRIKDINIIPMGKDSVINLDLGLGRLLPLPSTGLGMVRLLRFVTDIMNCAGGVVLIDEIDNGLHWSKLKDVWNLIKKTARKYDVQVLATTHSLECIQTAFDSFGNDIEYDLGIHRLEKDEKGFLKVISYPKETIASALENNLDVR